MMSGWFCSTPSPPTSTGTAEKRARGAVHGDRAGAVCAGRAAAEPVPADRRLRVPVRLREHLPDLVGRLGGVAVRAAPRLAQRVRRHPGPRRRPLPARARTASRCPSARRYLPGSLILETTWQTHTGWLIVRDALVMGPWHDIDDAVAHPPPHPDGLGRRAHPAAHRAMRQRHRRAGDELRAGVRLPPRGTPPGSTRRRPTARRSPAPSKNPEAHPTLRLTTNLRIGLEGHEARARTRLNEGDNVFVALSWSRHPAPQTYEEAADKMWKTSEAWRQWINIGDFPDHPWRSYLQRSALTLKGLTYSPTGALLAASTTSLPETPQGERNWDYRYAWVRDSTFALWGLYTLGLDREADDFFSFIADVSGANNGERHPLQVMYGVGGERSLVEEELQPPVRLRQRAAGAHRQRRLRPDAARHLGHDARFGVPARQVARADPGDAVAGAQAAGRGGDQALARTRPRHLGGARRAAALHLEQDHVLGGAGPRLETGRAAGREELRPAVAGDRRGDQGRHPRPRRRLPRRAHPALRRRRAGRVAAAGGR